MKRKLITLTESELRRYIKEVVNEVLNNDGKFEDLDISTIPIEDLKRGYIDLRLVPTSTVYGDVLSDLPMVKEAMGDILPPDDIAKRIIQKYHLPPSFVVVQEHYHKICVYIVIAKIGINDTLIEKDMQKAGYFIGNRQKPQTIGNMVFQVLQFEPTCQMQDDVTQEVKSIYSFLLHWTPAYCVDSIMQNGLIPSHKNERFEYPPRTYLMGANSSQTQVNALGQQLCLANNNPQNNGEYVLLKIDINNIDDNIRFYYDPNSEIGIYTEQKIPPKQIQELNRTQFLTSLLHSLSKK